MHALNRREYAMPVVTENYLHPLAGDELGSPAMMPCILLALPNPALPFMAGVPVRESSPAIGPGGARPAGTIRVSGCGMPPPGCACWRRPRRW